MKQKIGVILIHGFGGCKEEVQKLHTFLNEHHVPTFCIDLPGHGSHRQNIKKTNRKEWIQAIKKLYLQKSRDFEQFVLIGFSMGGLLSVQLTELKPASIVFINTPVYYWNIKQIIKNLVHDFRSEIKRYAIRCIDKPLPTLIQFCLLLRETKKKFKEVSCPALIFQTKDDDLVYPISAKYIYKRVQNPKPIEWIENSGHFVLEGEKSPFVCKKILEHIKTLKIE